MVTHRSEIRKLNQKDLEAGVIRESELPDYMLYVSLNGESKMRLVSGAENLNQVVAEDRAKGAAVRLSGGSGLLPLPVGSFINLLLNKNRQPVSYDIVSIPFGKNISCQDLQ